MNLKETLEKHNLSGDVVADINAAVDKLKAKAIAEKDKVIKDLQTTVDDKDKKIDELNNKAHNDNINSIVKELVGDNEKNQTLLKKLTDLEDEEDIEKIKEKMQETMKEYENVFNVEDDIDEEDIVEDDTIDTNDFNETAKPTTTNKSQEVVEEGLAIDK